MTSVRLRREVTDLEEALKQIAAGDISKAEALLLSVIAKTPNDYSSISEDADRIKIAFWDFPSRLHYISWLDKQGGSHTKPIIWIRNVRPPDIRPANSR